MSEAKIGGVTNQRDAPWMPCHFGHKVFRCLREPTAAGSRECYSFLAFRVCNRRDWKPNRGV